jgi:ATP-dependent DNA helicase RecQ
VVKTLEKVRLNHLKSPEEILKHYWGYNAFRESQTEIIDSVLSGVDTVGLLPTGGGKSLCFQIPTLILDGVCLVITPLIGLMKDQVEELKRRNIRAAAIYSGLSKTDIDYSLDNFVYGDYKFLYLSPERLLSEIVIERIKLMKISLIAIDEAHCVSQWGHDFRPAYLRIPDIYPHTDNAPRIALTATATSSVQKDIIEQLQLVKPVIFRNSFARKNLSFSVFDVPIKEHKLIQVIKNVGGSGIVYVGTRRRAVELTEFLVQQKVTAAYYHGGVSNTERFSKQKDWLENKIRVMVATNAFGMGINKPDVRFVIHADMSANLEGYYQEAGRAGRDGLKAFAVALYNEGELEKLELNILRKYVPIDALRTCYQALCNYYKLAEGVTTHESFGFDLHNFISVFGFNAMETHSAIKLLESQSIISLSDNYYSPPKIHLILSSSELYNFYLTNPNAEKLLKTLLRMYGGELYNGLTKIAESEIARALFMSEFETKKKLSELDENGVIVYQKQRNSPQITFLTKRYDANILPINSVEIEQKKKADLAGVRAVTDYIQEPLKCRMLLLQEYFDDYDGKACGICDNCIGKNKMLASQELISYKEKLLDIVPVKAEELMGNHAFGNIGLLKLAISHLIQNESLKISEMGVLEKRS